MVFLDYKNVFSRTLTMKKSLIILVLLFSSSLFAEETNQLLEIKVNELSVYKKELLLGIEEEKVKLNYVLINNYDKLIKLVDHSLITKDLLGETVTVFYLEEDIYLPPNTQKSFVNDNDIGWLSYRPFRLRKIKFEDLVFEHEVESIVFENNFILNIDSEN